MKTIKQGKGIQRHETEAERGVREDHLKETTSFLESLSLPCELERARD